MLRNSFQFYPKQTFLDYTEETQPNKESYFSELSVYTDYSINASVDNEYESYKVLSVDNFLQYNFCDPFTSKKKTASISDTALTNLIKRPKQNSSLFNSFVQLENQENVSKNLKSTGLRIKPKKKASENDFKVKYKTEVCKYWEEQGMCPYDSQCTFAHGKEEKRSRSIALVKYRTKKCTSFHEHLWCFYGSRCQFLHSAIGTPENEINANSINALQEDSFQKQLENPEFFISDDSGCLCVRKFLRPRLPVFQKLTEVPVNE